MATRDTSSRKQQVIQVDPDLYMRRMLHYNEKQSGWYIFSSVYWSVYLFIVGITLLLQSAAGYSVEVSVGISFVVLALMLIIYGAVSSLHLKLMKRYA